MLISASDMEGSLIAFRSALRRVLSSILHGSLSVNFQRGIRFSSLSCCVNTPLVTHGETARTADIRNLSSVQYYGHKTNSKCYRSSTVVARQYLPYCNTTVAVRMMHEKLRMRIQDEENHVSQFLVPKQLTRLIT